MYLISLIVSIYNTDPKFLRRLLDSINSCNNKNNYQLVLIDDCSTNIETINFLKQLKLKNNEKIIFNKKNHGLAFSRNQGILNSDSKYLWFLDADDYIADDWIYKIESLLKQNNYDLICFFYTLISKNSEELKLHDKLALCNLEINGNVMTWSKIWKKDFLIANNCFFYEIRDPHEDIYFFILILKYIDKSKIYNLNESLYFYDKNNTNSITNNTNVNETIDAYSKYIYQLFNVLEKKLNSFQKEYIENHLIINIIKVVMSNNNVKYKEFIKFLRIINLLKPEFNNLKRIKKILLFIILKPVFRSIFYMLFYIKNLF